MSLLIEYFRNTGPSKVRSGGYGLILSLVNLPWTAGVIINIKEKLIPAIEYEKVKHHICKF